MRSHLSISCPCLAFFSRCHEAVEDAWSSTAPIPLKAPPQPLSVAYNAPRMVWGSALHSRPPGAVLVPASQGEGAVPASFSLGHRFTVDSRCYL